MNEGIKIKTTLKEIHDRGKWDMLCEMKQLHSDFSIHTGTDIELSFDEAVKLGLLSNISFNYNDDIFEAECIGAMCDDVPMVVPGSMIEFGLFNIGPVYEDDGIFYVNTEDLHLPCKLNTIRLKITQSEAEKKHSYDNPNEVNDSLV